MIKIVSMLSLAEVKITCKRGKDNGTESERRKDPPFIKQNEVTENKKIGEAEINFY